MDEEDARPGAQSRQSGNGSALGGVPASSLCLALPSSKLCIAIVRLKENPDENLSIQ
jgi:hypothetical protein